MPTRSIERTVNIKWYEDSNDGFIEEIIK